MIRWVFIVAMTSILCIVLYIPSAVPPERFIDVLRAEHEVSEEIWGPQVSRRILARMLAMQDASTPLSVAPKAAIQGNTAQRAEVDAVMLSHVSQMSMRLFRNPYFRSIDALFVLVTYRLSAAVEGLPLLAVFLGIVGVDGFVIRQVRAREFIAHSAEIFGASVVIGIALASVALIACFLPLQMHPMFITASLLVTLFMFSRAVANYHLIH